MTEYLFDSPEKRKQDKLNKEKWEADKLRWEADERRVGHSPPIRIDPGPPSPYPSRSYCPECKRLFTGKGEIARACPHDGAELKPMREVPRPKL
jgi:hypothetical protein